MSRKKNPHAAVGIDTEELVKAYQASGGNVSKVARDFGVERCTVYYHLRKTGMTKKMKKPLVGGTVKGTPTKKALAPGQVRRFIFTSAQNNTKVPEGLWANLLALRDHYDAELMVGTFTYNKNAYSEMSVKRGTKSATDDTLWYDPCLEPYIRDERVQVAPNLIWCGEMNIIPTAARPLSQLGTYTGTASSIFPHAKIALASVPTSKYEPPKFTFTTGACTVKNYIQKLAGLKAEFHHAYGALLVEVDADGEWFARQLNADTKWRIYDLDIVADGGVVSPVDGCEAIVWGDIHAGRIDEVVADAAFSKGGILDQLRPRRQFMHDVLDFYSRSHHELKDHVRMWDRHVNNSGSVTDELTVTAKVLNRAARPWCDMIVVNSNHDRHLERWISEGEFKKDPLNAEFYLKATAAWYDAIKRRDRDFHLLPWALRLHGLEASASFLKRDESFVVLGVEHGMHGDEGPNGVKGTPANLANLGRKITMADKHVATIHDGVYVVGTFSKLDMGYNHGPSSWSHSFSVMHPNGKRQMVTMRGSRWRVPLLAAAA